MTTVIHYSYKCDSTATAFGQRLGVQECYLHIHDAASRFGILRRLVNSVRRNRADLVKVNSIKIA